MFLLQKLINVCIYFRWFHGKISREEAENLLRPRTDGLFLVRESTNFPGDYTLCVCFQSKVEHYRVKSNNGKLTIDDEEFFSNLEELIEHYENDADGLCTKLIQALSKENESHYSNITKPVSKESDDLFVIPEQELAVSKLYKCKVFFFFKNDFQICETIGKGEFCEVMLGKWKNNKVAVKVLKDSSEAEAILMK